MGQILGGKPVLFPNAVTREGYMSPEMGIREEKGDQPHTLNLREAWCPHSEPEGEWNTLILSASDEVCFPNSWSCAAWFLFPGL